MAYSHIRDRGQQIPDSLLQLLLAEMEHAVTFTLSLTLSSSFKITNKQGK